MKETAEVEVELEEAVVPITTPNNNDNESSTSNLTPVKHIPMPTDKMIKESVPLTITPQKDNTCVTSILEFINNKIYNGDGDISDYHDYYCNGLEITLSDLLNDGVRTIYVLPLVCHFFTVLFPTSYEDAINNGYPVMVDIPTEEENKTHNVLVIGYQENGDLIYVDPALGYTMTVDESYMEGNYKVAITGIK